MPSVYGRLSGLHQEYYSGVIVQAVDIDLRNERGLGEFVLVAGKPDFDIPYSLPDYKRAEIAYADIQIKALWNGRVIAESAIVFNAADRVRVDLDLKDWEPVLCDPLSELELLEASIASVRQNLPSHEFSDRDIQFLSHEAFRTQKPKVSLETYQKRLTILRDSALLSVETGIPEIAFYGWFRVLDSVERTIAAIDENPVAELARALAEAITSNIIPQKAEALEFDELIALLKSADLKREFKRSAIRIVGVFTDARESVLAGARKEFCSNTR